MRTVRSVMSVEKSLTRFEEDIIVDFVDRYSVTVVVIWKSLAI